jgi:archaellum biogenesis ATPase FlaH
MQMEQEILQHLLELYRTWAQPTIYICSINIIASYRKSTDMESICQFENRKPIILGKVIYLSNTKNSTYLSKYIKVSMNEQSVLENTNIVLKINN